MIYSYIRLSTARQSISAERQQDNIEKWAQQNNINIDEHYVEQITGSSRISERPVLSKLLSIVGKNDTVVVNDLTRLSRSQLVFNMIVGMLHQSGTTLMFADGMKYEEDDMVSRLMANIMSFVAEWEKEAIRTRTKQALQIVKKTKALGRPDRIKFGWRNIEGKKVPHSKEQELGELVLRLRNDGMKYKNIKQQVDLQEYKTRTGNKYVLSGLHHIVRTFEAA